MIGVPLEKDYFALPPIAMFGLRVGTRADFEANPDYDGEVFDDAVVSSWRRRFLQHDADRKRD